VSEWKPILMQPATFRDVVIVALFVIAVLSYTFWLLN
jgi:hypothetical protein